MPTIDDSFMSDTLDLCCDLIARPSVSPDDAGCQAVLCERLSAMDFSIETLPFGKVSNFWARRGREAPLLCFAGHTDVVPPGPLSSWDSDPFKPLIKDGFLYGRGAADMKGSLAAMVTACERFLQSHPGHRGSLAFLITSDEESIAIDGTRKVVDVLNARNEHIDYCVIGEPSSDRNLGDLVRNGRRGSLNGILRVKGQSGHVAYPHLAINPVHAMLPALSELCAMEWDRGNPYFPATSFQISNIHAGTGANNVIPGSMEVVFNFRFSTELTADIIKTRTEEILKRQGCDYELEWQLSGNPFITEEGILTKAVSDSIFALSSVVTTLSTGGGTSDGRFIAPTGAQVVELGPINASIHQNNEYVSVVDLDRLSAIYEDIMVRLLS
ncbi:MAG: succinyl-diaminopimelate desuccinylase [Pseudomonadales bacterium]|nr:succinyl-diaminopimelate desuccinylase [Pseudomonadales bacterium]